MTTAAAATRRSRVLSAAAALLVAAVAVLLAVRGGPMPRPAFVFIGVGLALGCLLWAAIIEPDPARGTVLRIGAVGSTAALLLRASGFYAVTISGIDHGRWIVRLRDVLATGRVSGTDMYASAPLYFTELAVGRRITGVGLHDVRFLTIAVATAFPAVVGVLTYRLADDVRVGLVGFLLAVPGPLFLRTSALVEAETLALLWFTLALLSLVTYLQTNDRRHLGLLGAFVLSAVLLHFLYAVVVFGTVTGTWVLRYLVGRVDEVGTPLDATTTRGLAGLTVIAGVVVPAWILASSYRRAATDTLRSLLRPGRPNVGDPQADDVETPGPVESTPEPADSTPDETTTHPDSGPRGTPSQEGTGTETATGDVGGGTDGEPIPDALFRAVESVVPSEGTVAQSIGVGTWRSVPEFLGAVLPIASLFVLSGSGGLIALWRRRTDDLVLLAATATVGAASLASVIVGVTFDLGYRLYYFLAILLTVFAAIAVARVGRSDGRYARTLRVGVLVLFLVYATVGPMSPLANNVDPRFGGTPWRITTDEHRQLESIDRHLPGDETIGRTIPQVPEHLRPGADSGDLFVTRDRCPGYDVVADGGSIHACRPPDR